MAQAILESNEDGVVAYTIMGHDGPDDRYMSRMLTPRIGDRRLMLHHIHRADTDRHMHNHPWAESHSIILHGGYTEERLTGDGEGTVVLLYEPGSQNSLTDKSFHRITAVAPDTWTLFMAGPRTGDLWGFLTEDGFVTHDKYLGIPAGGDH